MIDLNAFLTRFPPEGYMCQINTMPMKSEIGYLDVTGRSLESLSYIAPSTVAQSMKVLFSFHTTRLSEIIRPRLH